LAKIRIHSENAAYQAIYALKTNRTKRLRQRAFFVEGVRNINAAARYLWRFEAFICDGAAELSNWACDMIKSHAEAGVYELAPGLMQKLSGKTDASELAAIVRMRDDGNSATAAAPADGAHGCPAPNSAVPVGSPADAPVFILVDRPSGKGNLGTVMRSCDAFGVKMLYRTGHSVDFYDPEVIAASMGSFFAAPFRALDSSREVDDMIGGLRRDYPDLMVVGTSARGARTVYDMDLSGPLLFMIGNETDGLSWRLKNIADAMAVIPMDPAAYASSLNISCAATALLYESSRQKAQKHITLKPAAYHFEQ